MTNSRVVGGRQYRARTSKPASTTRVLTPVGRDRSGHDRDAFHPQALDDLDEIWEFLATVSNDAAARVIKGILTAIRAVVPLPHAGH